MASSAAEFVARLMLPFSARWTTLIRESSRGERSEVARERRIVARIVGDAELPASCTCARTVAIARSSHSRSGRYTGITIEIVGSDATARQPLRSPRARRSLHRSSRAIPRSDPPPAAPRNPPAIPDARRRRRGRQLPCLACEPRPVARVRGSGRDGRPTPGPSSRRPGRPRDRDSVAYRFRRARDRRIGQTRRMRRGNASVQRFSRRQRADEIDRMRPGGRSISTSKPLCAASGESPKARATSGRARAGGDTRCVVAPHAERDSVEAHLWMKAPPGDVHGSGGYAGCVGRFDMTLQRAEAHIQPAAEQFHRRRTVAHGTTARFHADREEGPGPAESHTERWPRSPG